MQKIKKELDRLVQEIVALRERGRCEKTGCKCKWNVGGHHVIKRSHLKLRWNPWNLVSLCAYHHVPWAEEQEADFLKWLDEKYPGRYSYLKSIDEMTHCTKSDLIEIKQQLEEVKDEYLNRSRQSN